MLGHKWHKAEAKVVLAMMQPAGSDPSSAWPGDPQAQGGAAAEHPEWNHTRNMHYAAERKPPPRHNLP